LTVNINIDNPPASGAAAGCVAARNISAGVYVSAQALVVFGSPTGTTASVSGYVPKTLEGDGRAAGGQNVLWGAAACGALAAEGRGVAVVGGLGGVVLAFRDKGVR